MKALTLFVTSQSDKYLPLSKRQGKIVRFLSYEKENRTEKKEVLRGLIRPLNNPRIGAKQNCQSMLEENANNIVRDFTVHSLMYEKIE